MTDKREEALRLLQEAVTRLGEWPRDSEKCADLIGRIERLARAQPQQEPVAWIADIKPYADHRKTRCIVFSKDELAYIEDGKTVWTPLYASPPAQAVPVELDRHALWAAFEERGLMLLESELDDLLADLEALGISYRPRPSVAFFVRGEIIPGPSDQNPSEGWTKFYASPPAQAVPEGRQPIPVKEIIHALERESGNTDTDACWLAANRLRHMTGWETRTLMCHIDKHPSETLSAASSLGGEDE